MRQALHIFRKDIRHLWPRAVLVLLLVVIHAFLDVRSLPVQLPQTMRVNTALSALHMLLPLGVWFLIAWVIFQEPLPGDRQFWLTRPYRWPALLASKLLFVLTFVSIPLFLSDCYILGAQGFPVLSVFPRLLLRQLFLAAVLILPAFAIAAVTRGVTQFLLGWFALVFALVCLQLLILSLFRDNGAGVSSATFDNSIIVAMVAVAIGVIIWQYAARRTNLARLALSATACFPFFWLAPSLLHVSHEAPQRSHLPDRPAVQVAYDLTRSVSSTTYSSQPQGYVMARIPLTVSGLPPKTLLRGAGPLTIETGGKTWHEPDVGYAGFVVRIGADYFQSMNLPRTLIETLNGQPTNIQTAIEFEIVTDEVERIEPLTSHSFMVSSLGLCRVITDIPRAGQYAVFSTIFTCRAGLGESTETDVKLNSAAAVAPPAINFGPHSIPWGLSPTTDLGTSTFPNAPPGAQLEFTPHRQIARFERTLDLHAIRLVDFLVPNENP
jgi:hypothetical protein